MKQQLWMIPLAHWIGLASLLTCAWMLYNGANLWWFLLFVVGYASGSLAVSVGLHRYFTHGAFQTNRFWHTVLALYATLTVQGSPIGWAAAHTTHHVHSDGAGDPHFTGVSYLWRKQYRSVPMVMWRVEMLIQDKILVFVHRYAVLVILGWAAILLTLGFLTGTGVLPLLFGYLAPLGATHLAGSVHQVISHRGGKGARDMPYMEWLFPAAGEWMHKHHHEHPRDPKMGNRWWHMDYGWWFIRMIRV